MAREVEARIRITAKDMTSPAFRSVARKMAILERTAHQMDRRQAGFDRAVAAVGARGHVFASRAAAIESRTAALSSRTAALAATAGAASGEIGLLSARFLGPAALGAALWTSTKQAANFEEALFGIQKKSGATAEEMARVKGEIFAITRVLPVAREEVAAAFERGAAAGIPIDKLGEFAVLTAKVADAWDSTAENVGNTFAGFEKGLGIPLDKLENYASLINDLADSGISDEVDIADFVDRAGASLRNFGLGAEEIAGYGAALINLKMPSEVAARAMDTLTGKLLAPENLSKKSRGALTSIVGDVKQFQKLAGNARLMYFFEQLEKLDSQKRASYLGALLGEGFDDEVMRIVAGINEVRRNQEMVRKHNERPSESVAGVSEKKLKLFNSQLQITLNNLQNVFTKTGEYVAGPGASLLTKYNDATARGIAVDDGREKHERVFGKGSALDTYNIMWKELKELFPDQKTPAIQGMIDDAFASYGRGDIGHVRDRVKEVKDQRQWMEKHNASRGRYRDGRPTADGISTAGEFIPIPSSPQQYDEMQRNRLADQYRQLENARRATAQREGERDSSLRPEQHNSDLQRILDNIGGLEKGGSGRPWLDQEKIGAEVGQAAVQRIGADAGAIGGEMGDALARAAKPLLEALGPVIAQHIAAAIRATPLNINGGGVRGVNADTGRTMPASIGKPASTGG